MQKLVEENFIQNLILGFGVFFQAKLILQNANLYRTEQCLIRWNNKREVD
jgi:hypothetical protein